MQSSYTCHQYDFFIVLNNPINLLIEAVGEMMTLLNDDLAADQNDMINWISKRNAHIPLAELEFLIGIPPFDTEDDDEPWNGDDW